MPMKMYVFNDPKLAENLRSLGFSVIRNGATGKYCVPEDRALIDLLHTQFADVDFIVSNILCF